MNTHATQVLMIEDCQIAQKVARFLFGKFECKLDLASSGNAGIALAQSNHYHLLIVDVGLPDMSGIEAIEHLLAVQSDYRDTPIIALTAHDDDGYKESCLSAGFTSYYRKPLTHDSACEMLELSRRNR